MLSNPSLTQCKPQVELDRPVRNELHRLQVALKKIVLWSTLNVKVIPIVGAKAKVVHKDAEESCILHIGILQVLIEHIVHR